MPYKIVNGELVAETDKNYISLSSSKRELFDALKTQVQRAEAAEARIEELKAQLESIVTVDLYNAMQQRDEARRQLREAQTVIDALAQIVGAADEVKHQLEQARSDIEDYRAEIAQLQGKLQRYHESRRGDLSAYMEA